LMPLPFVCPRASTGHIRTRHYLMVLPFAGLPGRGQPVPRHAGLRGASVVRGAALPGCGLQPRLQARPPHFSVEPRRLQMMRQRHGLPCCVAYVHCRADGHLVRR
jgi:hypothetical protein